MQELVQAWHPVDQRPQAGPPPGRHQRVGHDYVADAHERNRDRGRLDGDAQDRRQDLRLVVSIATTITPENNTELSKESFLDQIAAPICRRIDGFQYLHKTCKLTIHEDDTDVRCMFSHTLRTAWYTRTTSSKEAADFLKRLLIRVMSGISFMKSSCRVRRESAYSTNTSTRS